MQGSSSAADRPTDQGPETGRSQGAGQPRGAAATVVGASVVWYAVVLVAGTIGGIIGFAIPCDRGLACLTNGFYGAGLGALVGLIALAFVSARFGMQWWWVPTSLVLVVLGLFVGQLLGPVVGWIVAGAAPVLAGAVSLRPGRGRPVRLGPTWRTGLGILALCITLSLGAMWMVDQRDQRDRVAEIEAVGLGSFAPWARDDLLVSQVYSPHAERGVGLHYTLSERGVVGSWITVEHLKPGSRGAGCNPQAFTCEKLDGGITVATSDDRVSVYRDLDTAVVRVGPTSGSNKMNTWTLEQLIQLTRDLKPVDPAWVVSRADRG